METTSGGTTNAGIAYWVTSIILLAWGAVSVLIFVFSFLETPEEYARRAEAEENWEAYASYIANTPLWASIVATTAAVARLVGAVGLLLRRTWAVAAYAVALVCFSIALVRAFGFGGANEAMSGGHVATQGVFLALSLFALWFARRYRNGDVLR